MADDGIKREAGVLRATMQIPEDWQVSTIISKRIIDVLFSSTTWPGTWNDSRKRDPHEKSALILTKRKNGCRRSSITVPIPASLIKAGDAAFRFTRRLRKLIIASSSMETMKFQD